jgi:hypothetical protein
MDLPQFPPLQKQPHTVFTPEQVAEDVDYTNQIETTPLGELINRSLYSGDSRMIFDPSCKEVQRSGKTFFEFFDVLPGEPCFSEYLTSPDVKTVQIADIMGAGHLLAELMKSGRPFQFVAAPGTDRETRIRVKASGAIQRIGRAKPGQKPVASSTGFSLVLTERTRWGNVLLVHETTRIGSICWLGQDNLPTGEVSLARYAVLSLASLWLAGDLFDAITALDAEALAAYGRVVWLCAICGRPLKDAESLNRGVGPDCWASIKRHAGTDGQQ